MRIFAKVLALLWGGWWTFFGLASGIGEGSPAGVIFVHALVPGLLLLGSALIALKWERTGGAILAVEGVAIAIAYPMSFHAMKPAATAFVLLTMALPPLVSGLILATRKRPVRTE